MAFHHGKEATMTAATATEFPKHRRISGIGSPQRHYRLEPALITESGTHHTVVVAGGTKGTYVFAADATGEIADYQALAIVPVTTHVAALSKLGYQTITG
jgi:hypothetical protein